jgi:hypothetical protein
MSFSDFFDRAIAAWVEEENSIVGQEERIKFFGSKVGEVRPNFQWTYLVCI